MKQRKVLARSVAFLLWYCSLLGQGQDRECPLRCMNGSVCEQKGNNSAEYRCACEEGFTGFTCSTVYESCADSSPYHTCYHGGSCVVGQIDDFGNRQYSCDCTTATRHGRYYTGPYCQEEHIQSCDDSAGIFCRNGGVCKERDGENYCHCEQGFVGNLCDEVAVVKCGDTKCYNGAPCIDDSYCDCTQTIIPGKQFKGTSCDDEASVYCDESKTHFCLNYGDCVDEGNGSFSCNCADDWIGPSCEFESPEQAHHDNDSCNVECFHGGKCQSAHIDDEKDRCVCPSGYTGTKCEYAYEECGNGEHMCLHGTQCVFTSGLNPKWTCECPPEKDTCQHFQMTVCTTDDASQEVYAGLDSVVYCVNDGVCMEIEQHGRSRPGCKCPKGWTGAHCELLDSSIHADDSALERESGASKTAMVAMLALVVIAFGTIVGVMVRRKRTRSQIRRSVEIELASMTSYQDNPMRASPADDQSIDSGSLEDVELL
eukprot:scaffold3827_cov179-Cylindrotheca_fusiformis.AAC.34